MRWLRFLDGSRKRALMVNTLIFAAPAAFFAGCSTNSGAPGERMSGDGNTHGGDGDAHGGDGDATSSPDEVEGGGAQTAVDGSGQTGSIGPVECYEKAECRGPVDELVRQMEDGGRYYHTFDKAECLEAGVDEGTRWKSGYACECGIVGSSGTLLVGLTSCAFVGVLGECIMPGEEFEGCEAGTDSCDEVCAELESQLAASASRTFETEVRMFDCRENDCVSVVRVGDKCVVNEDNEGLYDGDCSLSDEELLERYHGYLVGDLPDVVTTWTPSASGGAGGALAH